MAAFYPKPHSTLNRNLWKGYDLKPEIREALLEIGREFYDFLGIDPGLADIRLTGSMANYNYHKLSDIDLHLVVDYDKILKSKELTKEFLRLKKSFWNAKYDITVKGHPVEVYVEDISEPSESAGTFSITNNKWIRKPKKKIRIRKTKELDDRYKKIKKIVVKAIDSSDLPLIEKTIDMLSELRAKSLRTKGEMGIDNVIYKILRNEGIIEKLHDAKDDAVSQKLTVETDK